MRLINSLFMIVIGMIAFTAAASTPLPEKNQTVTIEKNSVSFQVVSDVLPTYVLTVETARTRTFFVSYNALSYSGNSHQPLDAFAIITDVGWYLHRDFNKTDHYTEKLNKAWLIDHEKNLFKLGITNARSES